MTNMKRVLRESWRGEGGRRVIDFKSDGKTQRSQGEQRVVSMDTAAAQNNGINFSHT